MRAWGRGDTQGHRKRGHEDTDGDGRRDRRTRGQEDGGHLGEMQGCEETGTE